MEECDGRLFRDVVMTVSGRQMHAGLEELGVSHLLCSGSLILNGGKVVEVFGFKILNLEYFFSKSS